MLLRLRAWFAGSSSGDRTALSPGLRMFVAGLVVRLLYMTLAHTFHIRAIQDHFQFGWEMGRTARAVATG